MEKIIEICLNNNGIIIGGYVRDFIAGIKPNDIDVVIDENNMSNLMLDLSKLNKSSNLQYFYKNEYSFPITTIYINNIKIDILNSMPIEPDFDINQLILLNRIENRKNTIDFKLGELDVSVSTNFNLDIFEIIKNIKNKNMVFLRHKSANKHYNSLPIYEINLNNDEKFKYRFYNFIKRFNILNEF